MIRGLAAWLVALVVLASSPAQAVTIERVTSPGGIEAWLIRDHTIPILALEAAWRGGAALDPEGKVGLAHLLSGMLDEGAGPHDSQAFQGALEDLSVRLSFEAGRDTFRGRLKTLTENRAQAFELMKLALTQPRFDPEPLERTRSQILASLAREAEDPDTLAARAWFAAAFAGHPYARPANGRVEDVKGLAAGDLKAALGRLVARDNLIVGVVGDITPEALRPLLDSTFGALPAKTAPRPGVADVRPHKAGPPQVVRKPIPQSVAVFGLPGLKRDDPDWYTAFVMNYILGGGGFASRLMIEVREKRGLAYSVYSYLQPFEHAGILFGGVATENARVGQSLDLIREALKHLRDEGVTHEELANAKTYLTGSFPLQFDNSDRMAGLLVTMQIDRLGIDFLKRRNALIEAVSAKEIRRVATRLLDPNGLIVVVVGDPKGL
jgi:zinc protease